MRSLLFSLLGFIYAGALEAKVLPVLNNPASTDVIMGDTGTTINLDTVFGTEPIDNTVVRFESNFINFGTGQPLVLDIALFTTRTPLSRANFLNYVNDGDYEDTILHRSVPSFVLQGGTYEYDTTTDSILNIPLDPPVENEFGISNTSQTVSIPKKGGFPDSGTSGWFINVDENSQKLDGQNGGFTVFGRVTKSTYLTAKIFENPLNFTVRAFSSELGKGFDELPVINTYTPPGLPDLNLEIIRFPTVTLVPLSAADAGDSTVLSYSIAGQSNPELVSPSLNGNLLTLGYTPGLSGSATVVVTATDSVGNLVADFIEITVRDTYARWRAANWSEPELSDDSVSGPGADANNDGVSNLELFATGRSVNDGIAVSLVTSTTVDSVSGDRFIQFDVPRRNGIDVNFTVEKSTTLKNWSSAPVTVVDATPFPASSLTVFKIRVDDPVSVPCQYRVRWDLIEE